MAVAFGMPDHADLLVQRFRPRGPAAGDGSSQFSTRPLAEHPQLDQLAPFPEASHMSTRGLINTQTHTNSYKLNEGCNEHKETIVYHFSHTANSGKTAA